MSFASLIGKIPGPAPERAASRTKAVLATSTAPAPAGHWRRSDGSAVAIADMNPYHRAAAAKKAHAAGDTALADQLEAPESTT